MPAGTKSRELTPGNLFSTRTASMYVYLGYYRDCTTGNTGYLYAGGLDTPSMYHFGTPTAPDRELMDYGYNEGYVGGIKNAIQHKRFRFTKHPVTFDVLEKTIDYVVISEVLKEIPGYCYIADRK